MARTWPKAVKSLELPKSKIPISLVIACRNEALRVPSLVSQIRNLDYPYLEVILVDDHSEDQTFDLLTAELEGEEHVKILRGVGVGKKTAISQAVSIASGELILCTDADCNWPQDWLETLMAPFSDPKIQLVAGPVLCEENEQFLSKFQKIDWLSILMVSNFAIQKERPIMCSAANMMYRKTAFEKVNGYSGNEKYWSGDDEFLLKKMVSHFGPEAIQYLPFQQSLVKTQAESNWSSLFNQRIRWAGKWKAHESSFHILSAFLPFLMQLFWISSFVLLTLDWEGGMIFLAVWGIKIVGEALAFGRITRSLNTPLSLSNLILTSFIHPFYVLGIGIGLIRGKYSWKGRKNLALSKIEKT